MNLDAWLAVLQSAAPPPARRWTALIDNHASVERVVALSRVELLSAGLTEREVERLKNPDAERLDRWRGWLARPGRRLVTPDSPAYPRLLKEVPGAPLALWAAGERSELLNGPQLAMVGSRTPTANGRETARRFAHYLSERGLTIVSGLATGIDGACHGGALPGCGGTIAVLGSGPDVIFPRAHARLAAEIAAAGLIVSEYPPGTPPLAAHFPPEEPDHRRDERGDPGRGSGAGAAVRSSPRGWPGSMAVPSSPSPARSTIPWRRGVTG